MNTKQCSRCLKIKNNSYFYKKGKTGKIHSYCKKCMHQFQKERWQKRKIDAVNLFGKKCENCGYNKNYAALSFHHKNPQEKEFQWNELVEKSWEKIIKELSKCKLLCSNCHMELHHPDLDF